MATAQKEYEMLFKLKAALNGNFNSSFKSAMSATKQLQNTLNTVNSLQNKIDGYKKQVTAIESNKTKLDELTKEHEKLKKEMQETENPSESLRKKFEKNAKQIEQVNSKIAENQTKLNQLGNELKNAGVNTDNLESANNKLAKSYDKIKSSQEEYARISSEHEKTRKIISDTKVQLAGTIGVATALGAAIYAGPVKSAMEFQQSMAKVRTIADPNEVPLDEMKKQILALSNETGIAATSLSEDVYNAISAGQKTADAVNFIVNSTKLAKAGFAESSQTLDILTTILNAYGMEASKVGSVSDMLIQIQNKGKVEVGQLSAVMGKIIPTAKSNNVALEQLGAGYAIMTAKGIAAAETTTYMNGMLNELGKSGTITDKLLRKTTGSSFKELMESGKSVGEVLGIIQDEATKSGKSLSDMFGSSEAGKAAVTLLADGVDGFNESVKGMIDSAGATQKALDIMKDTDLNKLEIAKNSIANLSIILGETFQPLVGNVSEKVTVLVDKISKFAQENPEAIRTIGKLVAGLFALKTASLVGKLGFLEVKSGIQSVQKVMSLFKGKAATASVEAMGLGTKLKNAGSGIISYFGNIKRSITTAKGEIGPAISSMFNFGGKGNGIGQKLVSSITKPFKSIGSFAGGIGSKISNGVISGFGKITGGITGTFGKVGSVIMKSPIGKLSNIIGSGVGKVGAVLSPLGNIISTAFAPLSKIGGSMLGSFGGIVSKFVPFLGIAVAVVGAIKLIKNNLDKIREVVGNVFGEKGLEIFDKFIEIITNVSNVIKGVFSEGNLGIISEKIRNIFGDGAGELFDKFIKIGKTVFEVISEVATVTANVIGGTLSVLIPVIQTSAIAIWNIIQPIAMSILGLIQFLLPTIQAIITNIVTVIGGLVSNIAIALQGIIQFISGVFTGNWQQAWEGITNIFSGIFGGIESIAKGVINGVISVINVGIRALNKIQIPEWVPVVGGQGINIPEIPQFAKGTNQTPDTFIAGEQGAELITNAKNRKVFTALETGNIFKNALKTQQAINGGVAAKSRSEVAPQISENTSNTVNEITNNANVINNNHREINNTSETIKILKEITSKEINTSSEIVNNEIAAANTENDFGSLLTSIKNVIDGIRNYREIVKSKEILNSKEVINNNTINEKEVSTRYEALNNQEIVRVTTNNEKEVTNSSILETIKVLKEVTTKELYSVKEIVNNKSAASKEVSYNTETFNNKEVVNNTEYNNFDFINKLITIISKIDLSKIVDKDKNKGNGNSDFKGILESIKTIAGSITSEIEIPQVVENIRERVRVVNSPKIAVAGAGGSYKIEVYNQPTIYVDGEKDGDLENKLKKNNETLLNMIDAKLRKKEEDETRSKYD